ncbi:MotA/TolQ/ExbB proton channel family protein [Aestuariispira insulae]|uniref:Biopolymer transport protein ExbB n=1 Tax=Aestuariispira insulae TaxID=1461337 RepID=A0A3D9H586_9PROT|nr:MotA/TolQ/ExbB proton channel family protein [Aestuariispira insulae]RED44657.1 biopolymer transport protein ExbB [Aestuariispira insulae]
MNSWDIIAMSPAIALINTAGPVGWILVAMSLLVMIVFFYKILVFWRSGLWQRNPLRALKPMLEKGQVAEAFSHAKGGRHPARQLVRQAIERHSVPGLTSSTLLSELEQASLDALDRLRSGLKIIAAIAALSPLLGLLGTVLGMIEAFRQMEAAGSQVDPAILSGGIWLALLTTAIGLIVAIPATAIHLWLSAVVARTGRQLEAAGTKVLSALEIQSRIRADNPSASYPAAAK